VKYKLTFISRQKTSELLNKFLLDWSLDFPLCLSFIDGWKVKGGAGLGWVKVLGGMGVGKGGGGWLWGGGDLLHSP
jgi:hypothetical protein